MRRHTASPADTTDQKIVRLRIETVRGNLQGVKDALAQGVSVDQPFRAGEWNALMHASSLGHEHLVRYLLEQGADPNYHKELFTPLMAACASNIDGEDSLVQCVQHLLQHHANADTAERHRLTALMFACKQGHTKIVAELLSRGVDVDAQDSQGWTALFWAVSKGKVEIVEMLVAGGADRERKDRNGGIALQLAKRKCYHEIEDILRYGARRHGWETKSDSSGCQTEEDLSNFSNSIDRNGDIQSEVSSQINKEISKYLLLHEDEFKKFEANHTWPTEDIELIKEFKLDDVIRSRNEDATTPNTMSSMNILAELIKQIRKIHLVMALLRYRYQNLATDSPENNKCFSSSRVKCLSRIAYWKAEQLYLETKFLYEHISKQEDSEFCVLAVDSPDADNSVDPSSKNLVESYESNNSSYLTTLAFASAFVIVVVWNTRAIGSFTFFGFNLM